MNAQKDPLIGKVILDRYQIVRRLGSGGMGTVYQARQLSMDRMVALKLIHPGLADNPAVAGRFHREMQASSVIEHSNTVRVFDFGQTKEGQLFLVMEFLEGLSLADLLERERRLPVPRIVYIGNQILKALGAAHQEGIVHRDLKPENVMLLDRYGERDFVKVLDFGIARFLDGDQQSPKMTVEGSVLGTPAYMSPEQAMGKAVGPASDLYSFGILLYQMASGALPFHGETLHEILIKQATEPPTPPSKLASVPISPALESLILDLLQKDAQRRPSNTLLAAKRLAACLEGDAGQAESVPIQTGNTQVLPHPPLNRPHADTPITADGDPLGSAPQKTQVLEPPSPKKKTPVPEPNPSPIEEDAAPIEPASEPDDAPVREVGPRASSWVLPSVMAALVVLVAGLGTFAAIRFLGSGKDRKAAAAARVQLDAALGAGGAPAAPLVCQVKELKEISALQRPAELLVGASPGTARPQDAEALELLEKRGATSLDGAAEYWGLLARARLSVKNDWQSALDAASASVKLCPSYALAHTLMGTALADARKVDEAWSAYQKAVSLSPDYVAPRADMGLLALKRGDAAGALALLDDVLEKRPDDLRVRLGRGQARLRTGNYSGSISDLDEVTRRQPDRPDGWLTLGHALAKSNRWEEALSAFCKAKSLGSPEAVKYCISQ